MRPQRLLLMAAGILMLVPTAFAGAVVTFEPSTNQVVIPSAGTLQFTVDVRLAADVGTQDITGYTIITDISPPIGQGLPTGWQIASVTQLTTLQAGFFESDAATPAEGDLRVGDLTLGAPVVFDTNPTSLFRIAIELDSTAELGTYQIGVFDGTLSDINGIPSSEIDFSNVAIITAVPEPLGLPALLATCLGWLGVHRRKRPAR